MLGNTGITQDNKGVCGLWKYWNLVLAIRQENAFNPLVQTNVTSPKIEIS